MIQHRSRRFLSTIAMAVAALTLTACDSASAPAASSGAGSASAQARVVRPGSITDDMVVLDATGRSNLGDSASEDSEDSEPSDDAADKAPAKVSPNGEDKKQTSVSGN